MKVQETANKIAEENKAQSKTVDPMTIRQVLASYFPNKPFKELHEAAVIAYLMHR